MATYDRTGCGPTNGVTPFDGVGKIYVLSNEIDLTADTMVAADVYQALAVPADTLVLCVKTEVLTAAVATALTFGIGDGGATSGWDAAIDVTAAAGTFYHSKAGTDARQPTGATADAGIGYFYDAADSIDVILTTVTTVTSGPKIRVSALCADFNG